MTHVEESHPADPSPTPSTSPAPTPDESIAWDTSLAIALPVSQVDGPTTVSSTSAIGFAQSPHGAALAAAHLLARTSPTVGPTVFEPALANRVRGPNRDTLGAGVRTAYATEADTLQIHEGEPLPGADGRVEGYRPIRYSETDAAVDVVLGSVALDASQTSVAIRVSLQWSDGDWQVIAPPRGDWAVVTRVIDTPATGMLAYGGSH